MAAWLAVLQQRISGSLVLGQNFKKGFFLLKAGDLETSRHLLLLAPYRAEEGLCIFQRWFAGFDPTTEKTIHTNSLRWSHSMKIPTWITLKQVLVEFMGVIQEIVASIGDIIGSDLTSTSKEPRFYLGSDSQAS